MDMDEVEKPSWSRLDYFRFSSHSLEILAPPKIGDIQYSLKLLSDE